MSSLRIDASDVQALAFDLREARGRIQRDAPRVLREGADRVRRGMVEEFSGHRHLEALGGHVGTTKIGDLEYEIGIDKGGQGSLGNVAAYGTSNNAPVADKNKALIEQTPFFEHLLGNAGEDDALGGTE